MQLDARLGLYCLFVSLLVAGLVACGGGEGGESVTDGGSLADAGADADVGETDAADADDDAADVVENTFSVDISETSVELELNEEYELSAQVVDEAGEQVADAQVNWHLEDDGQANISLSSDGSIRAIGPIGDDVVVASYEGAQATAQIDVVAGTAQSLEIQPQVLDVPVGQSESFEAIVHNQFDAEIDVSVVWESADESIAEIDATSGEVTGVAVGTAEISATVGGLSETATVEVQPAPPWVIETDPASAELAPGDSFQITAAAYASDGSVYQSDDDFAFSSINTQVAQVDAQGQVSAVGYGETRIMVSLAGSQTAVKVWVGLEIIAFDTSRGPDAGFSSRPYGCAITSTNDTFCWGVNASGQLGDGTTEPRDEPVMVGGGHSFTSVSTGTGGHTCALTAAGEAYCWGSNDHGELGDGSTQSSTTPVRAAASLTFDQISVGSGFTCGLATDSKAHCWGSSDDGQLGSAQTDDQLSPVAVSGDHSFVQIDAGPSRACGRTAQGDIWCWGARPLGDGGGSYGESSTPVQVQGSYDYVDLSVGEDHSCAATAAGDAVCWGEWMSFGPQANPNGYSFETVSAPDYAYASNPHFCATDTAGRAWCWPDSDSDPERAGGDDTFTRFDVGGGECGLTPNGGLRCRRHHSNAFWSRTVPTPMEIGEDFVQVSAQNQSSCAVTTAGDGYCWGFNFYGQLGTGALGNGGDGNSNRNARLAPTQVVGGHDWAAIDVGYQHSCGVTAAGDAYCWGNADSGRLGVQTTESELVEPNLVDGGLTFESVVAGRMHSCGVTTGAEIYCWGQNDDGELGDGSTTDSTTPVAVDSSSDFETVVLGTSHTCGLTRGGEVYCWGTNANGNIGADLSDRNAPVTTPTAVAGGHTFVDIEARSEITCATTDGDEVFCWGGDSHGHFARPSLNSFEPAPMSVLRGSSEVRVGDTHACAEDADGLLYCWGARTRYSTRYEYGQLGLGVHEAANSPTLTVGVQRFDDLALGAEHSCAVTVSGQLYCWGKSLFGAFGRENQTRMIVLP